MVKVATLNGVRIYIYVDEHPPPHFHAVSGEHVAQIRINPPALLQGSLPPAIKRRVLSWAAKHRDVLLKAWDTVAEKQKPGPIS